MWTLTSKIDPSRLAEPEYARRSKPEYGMLQTRFGRFLYTSEMPDSDEANHLIDCYCKPEEVDALLAMMEDFYAPLNLLERRIVGHDSATFGHLVWTLQAQGMKPICRR